MAKELTRSDTLYEIKEIMLDHSLTIEQTMYLLCLFEGIEYDIDGGALVSLLNKGLIVKQKVNATLLFHLKKPVQLAINLQFVSKPNGTEYTLNIADKIEKEFVIDKYLKDEERKRIANRYFKGDTTLARYFIIFKSLFPVKSITHNKKWNAKFGFIYTNINLWDDSVRVAKKFKEIYTKLDIGVFLETAYRMVKDSIDFEQEKCFMTKPYKFLSAFDTYYQETIDLIAMRNKKINKQTDKKINNLKV